MKEYEVDAEITIAKTVVINAPDADTAQIMAQEALDSLYNRLPGYFYRASEDDLTIEIGDANEVE